MKGVDLLSFIALSRMIIFSCSYKVLKKLLSCFLSKMKCNWYVRETRGAGAGGDRGEVRGLVANNTDTSLLGTACFVPGERTSLHFIRTLSMVPSGSILTWFDYTRGSVFQGYDRQ